MITFVTIFIVHFFALITPGPDFFLVTRQALAGEGERERIWTIFGICCGGLLWVSLSLAGLGRVMALYPLLQTSIALLGAAYLLYLAVKIVMAARVAESVPTADEVRERHFFRLGFLTNLANFKAMIYFIGLLAAFDKIYRHPLLSLALAVMIFAETFMWFYLIGRFFTYPRFRAWYGRHRLKMEYATAAVFMVFAAGIVLAVLR
ncbi:MAG: LysE family transporter [Neisseria sp.]|nr:LysE family transporter [Neisseria sp.]